MLRDDRCGWGLARARGRHLLAGIDHLQHPAVIVVSSQTNLHVGGDATSKVDTQFQPFRDKVVTFGFPTFLAASESSRCFVIDCQL